MGGGAGVGAEFLEVADAALAAERRLQLAYGRLES